MAQHSGVWHEGAMLLTLRLTLLRNLSYSILPYATTITSVPAPAPACNASQALAIKRERVVFDFQSQLS